MERVERDRQTERHGEIAEKILSGFSGLEIGL
jgi:hypothetical protein